jgi:HupE / UreJ protein
MISLTGPCTRVTTSLPRSVLLALALLVLAPAAVDAHATGVSYLRIAAGGADTSPALAWDIRIADLQLPLELDADGDGRLTARELDRRGGAVIRFAADRLEVRRGGAACRLMAGELAATRRGAEPYVSLGMKASCPAPGSLEVSSRLFFGSAGYSTLLDAQLADRRHTAVLSPGHAAWSEPPVTTSLATLWRFVPEGIRHVLIGYDHVAFVLLLLLPGALRRSPSGWTAALHAREAVGDLLRIVTAFTVAHSVTLGLAAADMVRVPVQPIEVAIAGSIVVAGVLNLFPAAARWRLVLASGFGLVHGFGFANALQELGPAGFRLAPMLAGFNIGVEIAQLAIVAAALPGIWALRRTPAYPRRIMPALSIATALVGVAWFAARL